MTENTIIAPAPPTQRGPLRRVFVYGWRYRGLFAISLAMSTLAGVTFGYLLLVIDRMVRAWSTVQSSIDNHGTATSQDLQTAQDIMGTTVWQLLALAPIAAAMSFASVYCGLRLANMCIRDLRMQFVAHLVRLDLGFHANAASGDLMARMMADLDGVRRMVQRLYGRILTKPPEILVLIGYITWLNWHMGVAAILCLLPLSVALRRIVFRMRNRSRKARKALAGNLIAFEQITSGIRVIKTMGSSERETQRFESSNQTLFDKQMRVATSKGQSEGLTNAAAFLMFALLLWMAGILFSQGLAEPASLIAIIAALARMTSVLRELQKGISDLFEYIPSAERMFAILDRPSALADEPDQPTCPPPQSDIALEVVSFRYQSEHQDVLRNISLSIPVGSTIAIVGPSGGGKTTLLDLIARLHDCTGGRVTWDGVDVRTYQPTSVIAHCAVVQQEPFLFDDTVYENIRYGKPDASHEAIILAAQRARIHDDILRLEGGLGYETTVGDRGSRLSGGQRQRVAIARALLRDAPVLLLDEPTSALDAESERHVQQALAELMHGRTTIIVAHRLATVQHADCIYVLGGKDNGEQQGTILEYGSHSELMRRGGVYRELVAQQDLKPS